MGINSMTQYAFGYDSLNLEVLVKKPLPDDYIVVNIASTMQFADKKECISHFHLILSKLQQDVFTDNDVIVTSNEPINRCLREALLRGELFSFEKYDLINTLLTVYIKFFLNKPLKTLAWIPPLFSNLNEWEPKLYGRYGNVELRVLESWLRNPGRLESELVIINRQINDETYMYANGTSEHWLSTSDANFNLRTFMTIAGFYVENFSDLEFSDSLRLWSEHYLSALGKSHYLFPYPGAYPNFFVTQDQLFQQNARLNEYINFPGTEKFYKMLKGHDILLMSPFSREITELYNNKNLFHLYKDISIPDFRLDCVPAYISTYPNRPHNSWKDTFYKLIEEIDRAFLKKSYTLFFASCGCYGMPISEYVFSRYGCPTVYYGNFTNTLFGVRQKCSENFIPARRNMDKWARSHLGEFPNMAKVDRGRYI